MFNNIKWIGWFAVRIQTAQSSINWHQDSLNVVLNESNKNKKKNYTKLLIASSAHISTLTLNKPYCDVRLNMRLTSLSVDNAARHGRYSFSCFKYLINRNAIA